jgi:hypothetical protein
MRPAAGIGYASFFAMTSLNRAPMSFTPPPDSSAQTSSPSYRLAVEDTEFLLRDEMRALRFALEYAKAELMLRDGGVRSTIIVFGGARIASPQMLAETPAPETDEDRDMIERMRRQVAWYEALVDEAMISRADLELVDFADDPEEAWGR